MSFQGTVEKNLNQCLRAQSQTANGLSHWQVQEEDVSHHWRHVCPACCSPVMLPVLTHSAFMATLWGRYCYYAGFTDEEMHGVWFAQGHLASHWRSPSLILSNWSPSRLGTRGRGKVILHVVCICPWLPPVPEYRTCYSGSWTYLAFWFVIMVTNIGVDTLSLGMSVWPLVCGGERRGKTLSAHAYLSLVQRFSQMLPLLCLLPSPSLGRCLHLPEALFVLYLASELLT